MIDCAMFEDEELIAAARMMPEVATAALQEFDANRETHERNGITRQMYIRSALVDAGALALTPSGKGAKLPAAPGLVRPSPGAYDVGSVKFLTD